jgi:hypothetical protein
MDPLHRIIMGCIVIYNLQGSVTLHTLLAGLYDNNVLFFMVHVNVYKNVGALQVG